MNKDYISWEQIQQWSKDLSQKISAEQKDLSKVTLVAVSRGGLIPVQLISYNLDIRDIRVIKLISYDENNQRGETQNISTDEVNDGQNVYIIDDLADSGETVKYLRNLYPQARQCTLISKQNCQHKPDLYSVEYPSSAWLVFPWDE